MLKINIDVCFNHESYDGGWGFIIRDSAGEAVGAGAGKLEHLQDPLQAETEACIFALQAAQEWGMMQVVVKSDSQDLVHAILKNESDQFLQDEFLYDSKKPH